MTLEESLEKKYQEKKYQEKFESTEHKIMKALDKPISDGNPVQLDRTNFPAFSGVKVHAIRSLSLYSLIKMICINQKDITIVPHVNKGQLGQYFNDNKNVLLSFHIHKEYAQGYDYITTNFGRKGNWTATIGLNYGVHEFSKELIVLKVNDGHLSLHLRQNRKQDGQILELSSLDYIKNLKLFFFNVIVTESVETKKFEFSPYLTRFKVNELPESLQEGIYLDYDPIKFRGFSFTDLYSQEPKKGLQL